MTGSNERDFEISTSFMVLLSILRFFCVTSICFGRTASGVHTVVGHSIILCIGQWIILTIIVIYDWSELFYLYENPLIYWSGFQLFLIINILCAFVCKVMKYVKQNCLLKFIGSINQIDKILGCSGIHLDKNAGCALIITLFLILPINVVAAAIFSQVYKLATIISHLLATWMCYVSISDFLYMNNMMRTRFKVLLREMAPFIRNKDTFPKANRSSLWDFFEAQDELRRSAKYFASQYNVPIALILCSLVWTINTIVNARTTDRYSIFYHPFFFGSRLILSTIWLTGVLTVCNSTIDLDFEVTTTMDDILKLAMDTKSLTRMEMVTFCNKQKANKLSSIKFTVCGLLDIDKKMFSSIVVIMITYHAIYMDWH